MSLFSTLFGETVEKKKERWKQEIMQVLPTLLKEGDDYGLSDDQERVIVRRGGTYVVIGFAVDDDGDGYVAIDSPLVFLPSADLLPFYRRLLDLNDEGVFLGHLCTAGNSVRLRCIVPMEGLSDEAFGLYAFSLIEEGPSLARDLIEEFGVERYEDRDD